ncbi:hypothetical protein F2Q70_00043629 [Brassica cretica]|uniref:Uncharacterized protein n=1 Tax=Brassica cretica TaxID=69181 RepID=A0A8S9KII3_BRACR|nr:hypothetical protein F2Q70_00043629 [Brassica cretica]
MGSLQAMNILTTMKSKKSNYVKHQLLPRRIRTIILPIRIQDAWRNRFPGNLRRLLQTGCSVVPDDYIRADLNRSPLLTDFLESFSALRRKVYDHQSLGFSGLENKVNVIVSVYILKQMFTGPYIEFQRVGHTLLLNHECVLFLFSSLNHSMTAANAAFGKMWEESKKATLLVDRRV